MMYDLIEDNSMLSISAPLPKAGAEPPTWITIFPQLGRIATRDGRSYDVDAQALIERFEADGLDIPIDINHSTPRAASTGERADAVGWITELSVKNGALQGKVDWLDEGREVLRKRTHRFVSPDFFHTPEGKTKWLRAVALVTAPALANQRALAAAQTTHGASLAAKMEDIIYAMIATPMPRTKPLPEWVVVFAALGFVETQTEDIFYIDGKAICDAFTAARRSDDHDYRVFPVCIEHRPDIQIDNGEDVTSAPIGEIVDLQINKGRLEAKIDWQPEALQIVNRMGLTSVSPTFFSDQGGKVRRLKSISLVRRPMPLLRSRAVGNDAEPEERGYQPKAVGNSSDTRLSAVSDLLNYRVKQLSSIGRVKRDELFLLEIWRTERDLLAAGITPDASYIRSSAAESVDKHANYVLGKLFPEGGVRLEGAPATARSAPRASVSLPVTRANQLSAQSTKRPEDWSGLELAAEFRKEMTQASAAGLSTDVCSVQHRVMSRLGLEWDSENGRLVASAAGPQATQRPENWSALELAAEFRKDMAQASAAGLPTDVCSVQHRVMSRLGIERDSENGRLVASAAGPQAMQRPEDWSALELAAEFAKERAQASAAGLPTDVCSVQHRVMSRLGIEWDSENGRLVASK